MKESNLTKCKKCLELKVRTRVGKFPNGSKDSRYVDENGKQWNGLECSQCFVKSSKERMIQLRHKRALEKGTP
jgi:hypothetical protein